MKNTQRSFNLSVRPLLRVSEVERLIREHRIVVPPLSRRRIYEMCDSGEFECARSPATGRKRRLIYEESFLAWVKELGESE